MNCRSHVVYRTDCGRPSLNLKPATYQPLQTFPAPFGLSVLSHACWRQC
nr:MAG TPA: hypothetical protein [Bacteriophage sp.]